VSIFATPSQKTLLRNSIIRNLSAGLLLVLFAFCVTPKKIIHDLLADHKDAPFTLAGTAQQQFEYSGFRCNCDNLVVESPFVSDFIPVLIQVERGYIEHPVDRPIPFTVPPHFYFELRGPPFIA
jgi:hypothetical protein